MTLHCFRVALFAKLTCNATVAIHLDCACFCIFCIFELSGLGKNGMFVFDMNGKLAPVLVNFILYPESQYIHKQEYKK